MTVSDQQGWRLRRVGDRVRTLRHARDMSQERLATLAGTARSTIVVLEGGGRNITLGTLFGIADALSVRAAALLDDRTHQTYDGAGATGNTGGTREYP
ncbi:hypothetical protein BAY61_25640 [Prauserella marina]|uniref:Helix-turn-helix domain-containing protein n=1 Tax=Prauserella marina TaxID=530584 RepID=A0A222VVH2_9PSEU|nr:helix-turn-helix transcriptional regulator [Prauserella marina]ASR37822.1 hypothetical protein BAY61_25640 [Prauserella marina]PWV75786.1 helix-turn-helix protein [Prauserella marina]SDD26193.1 Helix-turn-helix domain-containing protein [Prauserella marina]